MVGQEKPKDTAQIRFAKQAGVSESLVQGCRDARTRRDSIATHLRKLVSEGVLTCPQTRHLLVAAFGLSIGHVQIVHMWCDGFIDDAALEESLFHDLGKPGDGFPGAGE